jgi:hypothetical protein
MLANRRVSDYCAEQAKRMKRLAKETADWEVRAHLTRMAENWGRQAKANESAKAPENVLDPEDRSIRFGGRGAPTNSHNKQVIPGS